jgi:Flp pilus assembly pilin Flp
MRLRRDERGQAVVEFALALPILLVVLIGLGTLGLVVNAKQQLEGVARHGARVFATTADLDQTFDALRLAGRQMERFSDLTTVSVSVSDKRQRRISERVPRQVCTFGWRARCRTVYDITTRVEDYEENVLAESGKLSSLGRGLGRGRDVRPGQWVTVVATYEFRNPVRAGIGDFRLPATFPITTRSVARIETELGGQRR